MAECGKCGIKTILSDDDIDKMLGQVKNMRGVHLADDELYVKRLSVCGECDKLVYGSTCAVCGCVVRVRALLSDGRCPKKKWLS